jgi:signal transduction histidine kinase
VRVGVLVGFLITWIFCFSQNIETRSSYYIDFLSKKSISQLEHIQLIELQNNSDLKVGFNKNTTVWLKIELINRKAIEQKANISFPNIHIDSLVLYDGNTQQLLGDRTNKKGLFAVAHVFNVKLRPNETKFVWIKIKKMISFLDFKYVLASKSQLDQKNNRMLIFTSVFVGLISMLILLNSILFFISKSTLYLYYVLYSFLTIVYLTISTGFAKFYVIPNCIWVSEIRVYSGSFWVILLFYFYKELLNTKNEFPKINKLIIKLSYFNIANMIIFFFVPKIAYFDLVKTFWNLGYLVFLIQGGLILYVTFNQFKKKSKISIYVCLSFLPHLIWFLVYILRALQIALFHEMNYEWLLIIALYEAVLFGFILAINYIDTFHYNNKLNLQLIKIQQESIDLIDKTQIRERRKIANIIHDSVGSQLAYIKNLIDLGDKNQVRQTIDTLSKDIRNLSHQILPKALDDGALLSAIENQINILNKNTKGVEIIFQSINFPELINYDWRFDIYLMSIELINNAIKHASGSEVLVEYYFYDGKFTFQFSDNGKGFDTLQTKRGFGLSSVENRIYSLNGLFELNSVQKEGTIIQLILFE